MHFDFSMYGCSNKKLRTLFIFKNLKPILDKESLGGKNLISLKSSNLSPLISILAKSAIPYFLSSAILVMYSLL